MPDTKNNSTEENNWEWLGITEERFLEIGKELHTAIITTDDAGELLEWLGQQDYSEKTKLFFAYKAGSFYQKVENNPLMSLINSLTKED